MGILCLGLDWGARALVLCVCVFAELVLYGNHVMLVCF